MEIVDPANSSSISYRNPLVPSRRRKRVSMMDVHAVSWPDFKLNNKSKEITRKFNDLDYAWMKRLVRLQNNYIIRIHQTQYELACLSTMGGAYSVCSYPREALKIAQQQEIVGIRIGSTKVQCQAKLYQYINLMFLGKNKLGLKMLKAAREKAKEVKDDTSLKTCDSTENWLKNEIKYRRKKIKV